MVMKYLFFSLVGYLAGGFLSSYILMKVFYHKNIFDVSKDSNPGTANAFVHGNFIIGCLTCTLDLAKGFLPVAWARTQVKEDSLLFVLVMLAPILGHCFPWWHAFNGGKGIAVSFGVCLGVFTYDYMPLLLLCFFYIFFSLIIKITPHKVRSIVTYFYFAVLCGLASPMSVISLGMGLISAVVIIKHILKYNEKNLLPNPKKPPEKAITR